ncbi:hypothetical protein DYBT9275_02754 [Dyadobacter sp. CECT 9275]|uniref:DUF3471 domain-containing protein n=1 Tax=Dyadobacter helix TaxID=2822344 RepID=A0A916JC70_9BACT|nr:hypothetical protein [Dyadobacter sp. CECT 9275]CAG5001852.1 hypothetical protein DYBT9275_02754 [Dyadobacter sp. CECT 9275]
MRKLAIFTLLSLFFLIGALDAAHAQVKDKDKSESRFLPLISKTTGKTIDTLSNATTKRQTVKAEGYYNTVSIITTLKKNSGTMAGKLYFQLSHDGIHFARAGGADSLTVTNVDSLSKEFNISPSRALFYRIEFVGSGTQSTRFNSTAILRK